MPGERDADVGLVALQHPGTGAHHALRLLEVPELLHALPGDDPGAGGREPVDEPRVRLAQGELHGVLVGGLHPVHHPEHRAVGIALDGEEPLVGVLHVLRGELAAVDRRLVVPPHALPELEDVEGVALALPRLREVGLHRLGARHHRGARLHLDQPAVGEGEGNHGGERDGLVRVEVHRRHVRPQAEGAAPLRALGEGGLHAAASSDGAHREGGAPQLQEFASGQ